MANWDDIVQQYGPAAYLAAWRVLGQRQDAEDAIQAALLSAWKLCQTTPIQNWGGLLRYLAIRRALDLLRRRKYSEQFQEATATSNCDPVLVAEANELVERLRVNLAGIPAREAEVFGLHFFGQLDCREIAVIVGITPSAVSTALHKAKSKLRSQMCGTEKEIEQ